MFQKSTPSVANTSVYPTSPTASHDEVETVVGPSVVVEGDFASEGNIVIKGTVSGSVKTNKLLTVEKGAHIFANVRAGSAIISGSIKGNVKIVDHLQLTENAQVMGDIECKILDVSAGALLQGKVSMKGIEIKEDKSEKKSSSYGFAKAKGDKMEEEIK